MESHQVWVSLLYDLDISVCGESITFVYIQTTGEIKLAETHHVKITSENTNTRRVDEDWILKLYV